jgi:hypothetical protein
VKITCSSRFRHCNSGYACPARCHRCALHCGYFEVMAALSYRASRRRWAYRMAQMHSAGTSCDSLNKAGEASKQWQGQEHRQHCCQVRVLHLAALCSASVHMMRCRNSCCTTIRVLGAVRSASGCSVALRAAGLIVVYVCTPTQSTQRADHALALAQVPAFGTVEVQVPQPLWQREAVLHLEWFFA